MLPKIHRRMPFSGSEKLFARLQDALYAQGLLSGQSEQELLNVFRSSASPEEWYEFAGRVFPAHQQRDEILRFLSMIKASAPRAVLEIGTAQGGTNFLIGQILDSVEIIIALDLRVRNKRLLDMFSRNSLKRICMNGSSHELLTCEQVQHTLSGTPLDLLFIDGDHSYEGVSEDYLMYRHLVRKGGLIAFHDIVDDHQTKYGRPSNGWAGGVPKFWNELKSSNESTFCWEFISDPDQDGMGIGVLQT
ncbi:MAG: class I SAM-dependent methyltransferase [Balneolales bacterium]